MLSWVPRPLRWAALPIALLWLGIGLLVAGELRSHATQGERQTSNLARLLAAHLEGRHARIDSLLLLAQSLYRQDPEGFRFGPWAGIGPGSEIVQAAIIGPDGAVRLTHDGPPPARIDVGDRHHVAEALAADAPDRLVIGAPMLSRIIGQQVISFLRPLIRADGSRAGAVMLSVDPVGLIRQYQALDLPESRVALFGLDGVVRARLPGPESSIGAKLPDAIVQPFRDGATAEFARRPSPFDGTEQFAALRRVEGVPLVVAVTLPVEQALADARRSALLLVGAGVLLSALALALAQVAARRRDEQARARARLEGAIAHVAQGIMMVDPSGRIAVVNDRVRSLLGLPEGLAKPGRPILNVIDWQVNSGEFGAAGAPFIHQLPQAPGPREPRVTERTRPDGTVLEVRTEYLPDGAQVRTFTDVTEARRAADAIAAARDQALAAEAALAAALDKVPHGVLLQGLDGRLVLMNSQAASLLDLPAELTRPGTFLPDIIRFQAARGDLDTAPLPEHQRHDMEHGINQGVPTYERRTSAGRILEVRTTGLADGRVIRTYTDVTERQLALGEQQAAREAAEAALRARTEFLSVVSHELRTPLNAVIGLSGVLLAQNPAPVQVDALRMIEAAGRQLLALVENILEATRLERGEATLQVAPFDPATLLREAAAPFAEAAARKGLGFVVAPDAALPPRLLGDAGRLRQVLRLLLGNAVKFTEAGGITLSARAAEAGQLEIAAEDTGIGIPEAAQVRLFEPFAQADSSIKRRYGGAGLGLALCRMLLEAMGGTISVESRAGEGSRFLCRLPLRPAAAEGNSLRVIAFGKAPAVTEALGALGHAVEWVPDAAAALAAARTRGCDLALLELDQAGEALAAARALRGLSARLPIIVLAEAPNEAALAQCRGAGVDRVERLPLTPEALVRAIQAATSREAA